MLCAVKPCKPADVAWELKPNAGGGRAQAIVTVKVDETKCGRQFCNCALISAHTTRGFRSHPATCDTSKDYSALAHAMVNFSLGLFTAVIVQWSPNDDFKPTLSGKAKFVNPTVRAQRL